MTFDESDAAEAIFGSSPEDAATLIAAMIMADGIADPAELALAKQASARFGIHPSILDAALASAGLSPKADVFTEALAAITEPSDREALAGLLFEIASVDERLDRREADLLTAMRDAWGVSVSFLNQPIEWDEDQQLVIEADPADRLLVSAGPGMGKTAVACSRVAYLVDKEDVSDGNIWLVSFTRAAIAEIRGRIGDFAEDPNNVFAVKIATIDSQAWKIRYGFSPEAAQKLFGGFETGIESAIRLMDEREDDFRDAFSNLEHVIIDEAQDVTGGRARFLMKLIELLPQSCGLTVFHDPAQAIYDYSDNETDRNRFTDALRDALGPELQQFSLKRIYRTKEPGLLKLYEDLRLDILGNADVSAADFEAKAEMVREATAGTASKGFDQNALIGYDEALVLFRRRIEVAQASAFMATERKPHRLRMSGLPRLLQPWLALTFRGKTARYLERHEFDAELERLEGTVPPVYLRAGVPGTSADERWRQLRRHAAASGDRLDLHALRARLATSPPDELMMTECGHAGPILGTIHASKGREADHVVLQINASWAKRGDETTNFAEESRVLFVGATRAKQSLAIQGGFAMPMASATQSGRSFRAMPKWKTAYQVQIGLSGDYDVFSAAPLAFSDADLARWTLPFVCTARLETGTWIYGLSDADGHALGKLTQALNHDLFEIGRRNPSRGKRPPNEIRNVFVLGFGTAVAAIGDERLSGHPRSVADSGFWLVPQIVGLPLAFLGW